MLELVEKDFKAAIIKIRQQAITNTMENNWKKQKILAGK